MRKQNKHWTPDWITELSDCEIFVFGSNLEGRHGGGAARIAYEKFGAEWGVGVGPTGHCYAIPTMHGGLDAIKPYIEEFIDFAASHPNQRFLLTRIGCGIAGFQDSDIAPLFWRALDYPNITHPKEWTPYMVGYHSIANPGDTSGELINFANEDIIHQLCEKYTYQIGAGIQNHLPSLRIRYVKGENEFGYARFGDFYFNGQDLYVWDTDDRWADDHKQDVVESIFHDQCYNRGYFHRVYFAGVQTSFKDTSDEFLYTGDIVNIEGPRGRHIDYAVLGYSDSAYTDNYEFCAPSLSYAYSTIYRNKYKLTRVGTMFFHINENDASKPIAKMCTDFVNMASNMEELLKKAVITPSIGVTRQQETLDVLSAEYHCDKSKTRINMEYKFRDKNGIISVDTVDQVKALNPWQDVAEKMDGQIYYSDTELIHELDKVAVKEYNEYVNDKNKDNQESIYTFKLGVPPAPFCGDVLNAKIIILSLNSGYVDHFNKNLPGFLKDSVRNENDDFLRRALLLEQKGIFEMEDKSDILLSGLYWEQKLANLVEDVGDSKSVYQKMAIIQRYPYSSTKFKPLKSLDKLGTSDFILVLIKYLLKHSDCKFLIMRSVALWEDFLKEIVDDGEKDRFIIKESATMNQKISANVLGRNNYQEIVALLKK